MKTLFFEEALETAKGSLTVKQDVGRLQIQTHNKPLILVEAKVKNVKVAVSRDGDNITVISRIPQSKKWFNLFGANTRAELIITVPTACALKLKMATGSIQIQDVEAAVKLSLATGSAHLANLDGPIEAAVVTGKIAYQGELSAANHRFKTVTGSIRLTLDSEPDLTLDAQTVTGAARCEFPLQNEKRRREFVGSGLQGVLGGGAGSLKITAVTGSVTIEDQRRKTNDQQTVSKEKALV